MLTLNAARSPGCGGDHSGGGEGEGDREVVGSGVAKRSFGRNECGPGSGSELPIVVGDCGQDCMVRAEAIVFWGSIWYDSGREGGQMQWNPVEGGRARPPVDTRRNAHAGIG
jgi:hypothetical protein